MDFFGNNEFHESGGKFVRIPCCVIRTARVQDFDQSLGKIRRKVKTRTSVHRVECI